MGLLTLTRRRAQLEVLAQACERHAAVRVGLPRLSRAAVRAHAAGEKTEPRANRVIDAGPGGPAVSLETAEVQTRLLSLQPDGLLLEWPAQGLGDIPLSGGPVDLNFEHAGEELSGRAETCGRAWPCGGAGQAAWKVRLPLRLERRRAERGFRTCVVPGRVPARCTPMADDRPSFVAEVRELWPAGMTLEVMQNCPAAIQPGELLWIDVAVPRPGGRFEFVVRVLDVRNPDHLRQRTKRRSPAPCEPVEMRIRCAFCGSEDPERQEDALQQLVRQLAPTSTRGTAEEQELVQLTARAEPVGGGA